MIPHRSMPLTIHTSHRQTARRVGETLVNEAGVSVLPVWCNWTWEVCLLLMYTRHAGRMEGGRDTGPEKSFASELKRNQDGLIPLGTGAGQLVKTGLWFLYCPFTQCDFRWKRDNMAATLPLSLHLQRVILSGSRDLGGSACSWRWSLQRTQGMMERLVRGQWAPSKPGQKKPTEFLAPRIQQAHMNMYVMLGVKPRAWYMLGKKN